MKKLTAVTLIVVTVVVTAGFGLMLGLRYLLPGSADIGLFVECLSVAVNC